MAEVVLHVDVDAPVEATWAALIDWERQGEWMLATTVRTTAGGGHGVGARLEAWTGLAGIGLLDLMEITEWSPPRRCEVRHYGRVIRGTGWFEVSPLAGERSRLTWAEQLDLPLGAVGRLGFQLLRPAFVAGVRHSLRRFGRQVPRSRALADPRAAG